MGSKILIVSRYFWPDKTPESLILNSLAKFLSAKGHKVEVLSSFPSYGRNYSKLNIKKTEINNGFKITRLKLQNEIGKQFFYRIINAVKLGLKTFFLAISNKYEIIIATSNPPVLGPFIAAFCSFLINSRFIYYCMDITPEVGKISGDFKNPLLFNLLKFLDTLSCIAARPLIVHSKDMKNTFLKRKLASKFEFTILNNFSVELNTKNYIHEKLDVYDDEKKLRVIYAGNIGRFQGLENAIYSMSKIRNHKDIELIIMGEGVRKEYLINIAEELKSNVKFIPYQNFELAKKYIKQADLGLISLSSGVYKYAYPSKTMAYLEQGKPIIAIVEEKSEIAKEIIEGEFGYVLSNNKESLSDLLLYLKSNQDELRIKSFLASNKYKNSFSASVILEKWEKIINY